MAEPKCVPNKAPKLCFSLLLITVTIVEGKLWEESKVKQDETLAFMQNNTEYPLYK